MARAPVSKTGGWGFETLHPCQLGPGGLPRPGAGRLKAQVKEQICVAFDPLKFGREVRTEAGRVTWPSRKETLITTGLVFAMGATTAIFFFVVDQIIGLGVRALFGFGV